MKDLISRKLLSIYQTDSTSDEYKWFEDRMTNPNKFQLNFDMMSNE